MHTTISGLARQVDVTADTIRYYERLGLLPPPSRTSTGYRLYSDSEAARLRFIKGAQRLGLRLRDIAELLEIKDRGGCPCGHTREVVQRRVEEIDTELVRLRALRRDLVEMRNGLESCPDRTRGRWWCETQFAQKGGEQQ
jgi:DNA-binding transcriptional MerR regulator